MCIIHVEIHLCNSHLSNILCTIVITAFLKFDCSKITPTSAYAVNVLSEFGSLLARFFGCSSAPQSSQNGQTVPLNLSPLQVQWCLKKSYFYLNCCTTEREGNPSIDSMSLYSSMLSRDFVISISRNLIFVVFPEQL